MKKLNIYILLIFLFTAQILFAQTNNIFNVKDFGAVGDGKTLDTEAVRKAVSKCAENGGTVLFPSGDYLIGSVDLKSNVDIYIQRGATLWGSTNIKDYEERVPKLKSYNDYFLKHSMFYAERVKNISIRGEGAIDGQGASYKITTKKKPERYMNRPFIIRFVECKNVKVEGVTLRNSAMWMQQYLACESLFIHGIKVYNHSNKNNDMIDIDGCKNVVMSDCIGDSDDDALTLKSTSDRITENVTITNCVFSSHCNAIKFGTESTGGFRNITISNIVIKPSEHPTHIYGVNNGISGITLGMVDGGIVEGIIISDIRIDGPKVPIYMRLGNRGRKHTPNAEQPGVGIFKDIKISNVIASNIGSKVGSSITGIPGHNIENVTLRNISIEYPGGGTAEDAAKEIEELEKHYPESTKFGDLNSYGFFVRHVNGITFDNVSVKYKEKDVRPAFVFDNVKDIRIINSSAKSDKNTKEVFRFENSENVSLSGFLSSESISNLVTVKGNKSKNVLLWNNDFRKVENIISSKNVNKKEIRLFNNLEK